MVRSTITLTNQDNGAVPSSGADYNKIGYDWIELEYPSNLYFNGQQIFFLFKNDFTPGKKVVKIENVNSSQFKII